MIPQRFVYEYPERCLQFIELMEGPARKKELVGSFSLMVAPSLLLIPYERLDKRHPLRNHEAEPELYRALRLMSQQKFLEAEFWGDSPKGDWRLARIVKSVDSTKEWMNETGIHPFSVQANKINLADVAMVIRVMRNALAHGNIVYLDSNGIESPGEKLRYLAFLSRYEETPEQKKKSETYRMLSVNEDGFLTFLKIWAAWLQQFGMDSELVEAA